MISSRVWLDYNVNLSHYRKHRLLFYDIGLRTQTTLISHKNTILWPQVENFMSFFQTAVKKRISRNIGGYFQFSTIEESADYLLFIETDKLK